MNRCYEDAVLQTYLDREETPDGVESHLAECAGCRQRLDDLAGRDHELSAALDLLGEAPPPAAAIAAPRTWVGAVAGALAASLACLFLVMHPNWGRPAKLAAASVWTLSNGETFVPLEGAEPVQIGTIEQVALPLHAINPAADPTGSLWVKADILLGEDGEPRAYHLLGN